MLKNLKDQNPHEQSSNNISASTATNRLQNIVKSEQEARGGQEVVAIRMQDRNQQPSRMMSRQNKRKILFDKGKIWSDEWIGKEKLEREEEDEA